MMIKVLVVLCAIIYKVSAQNCTLPNGQKSTCVRLIHCTHFATILQKYGGKPPQNVQDDIKAHQCQQPRTAICCPDNAVPEPPLKIKQIVDYNTLRSHRNLNLVNIQTCGRSTTDKLKGGWDAQLREIPWQALLGYTLRNDFKTTWGCGGSLISSRYVLTAAHCINRDLKTIRLGEHTISTNEDCNILDENSKDCNDPVQDLKIERTIRHPDYDRYKKLNDIALIKLEMPAKLSQNNIKTICLPIEAVDDVERTAKLPKPLPMTISGFGRLGNGAREPSNVLQKAFVPFVNIDECQKLYTARKSKDILEKQFCAGGKNATDTCSGDSGGPITNLGSKGRIMVYGVVLGGIECELESRDFFLPGVFTDIRYYLQWILDNISA